MKCYNCGMENSGSFCIYCGADLRVRMDVPPTQYAGPAEAQSDQRFDNADAYYTENPIQNAVPYPAPVQDGPVPKKRKALLVVLISILAAAILGGLGFLIYRLVNPSEKSDSQAAAPTSSQTARPSSKDDGVIQPLPTQTLPPLPTTTPTLPTGPKILSQPSPLTLKDGQTGIFTVEAEGEGLHYQWQKSMDGGKTWSNCVSEGADTNRFSFTASTSFNGWYYHCIVTDSEGFSFSNAALLTVTAD